MSLTRDPSAPPVLSGTGVVLRPWAAGDEAYVRALAADPEVRRWSVVPLRADDAGRVVAVRRTAERDEPPAWVVVAASSGEAVGDVSFRWVLPELRIAAIGYVVLARGRGRGVATEAVRLASAHVLGTLGWPRLELHHAVANPASCRVATKAGFPLEGTLRRGMRYAGGNWEDEHLHARLPGDP